MAKVPRHFTVILGRIGHIAIGAHTRTLCGRELANMPRLEDMTLKEAGRKADCKVCLSCLLSEEK